MHARADLIFSLLYVSARAHVGGFAFLDPSEKLHRQHFAHLRAQSARTRKPNNRNARNDSKH